jgi:membrane glycosyltransferase
MLTSGPAMRMQQSLSEFDQALSQEMAVERAMRERAVRRVEKRSRQRHLAKVHRRGSMRYLLLVLSIIATAVVVTIAMFETLYYVMG